MSIFLKSFSTIFINSFLAFPIFRDSIAGELFSLYSGTFLRVADCNTSLDLVSFNSMYLASSSRCSPRSTPADNTPTLERREQHTDKDSPDKG